MTRASNCLDLPTYYGRKDSKLKGKDIAEYVLKEQVDKLNKEFCSKFAVEVNDAVKTHYEDLVSQFKALKKAFNNAEKRLDKLDKKPVVVDEKPEKSSETMRKYRRS